jgi:hypothetical protein
MEFTSAFLFVLLHFCMQVLILNSLGAGDNV